MDAFNDSEVQIEKIGNRLIEDFTISKSEADAELTDLQVEKFEIIAQYFEDEG
jgi:hypothetical protein